MKGGWEDALLQAVTQGLRLLLGPQRPPLGPFHQRREEGAGGSQGILGAESSLQSHSHPHSIVQRSVM